ncbi:MAG: hypothetical protein ABR903_02365 [Thermodesulfovibrionales bacterium]|jgi:hypothetical protein
MPQRKNLSSGEGKGKEQKDKCAKPAIGVASITTEQSHIAISIHGTGKHEVKAEKNRITIIGPGIKEKDMAVVCCPDFPANPLKYH